MARYCATRPCPKCPFRHDVPGYLRGARARSIADALERGQDFPCHATVAYREGEEGVVEGVVTDRTLACAGSVLVLARMGLSTQMMRIAGRLGLWDPGAMDQDAPVFDDLDAFVEHHGQGEGE